MTALVTGGAGFIASNLVDALLHSGTEVIILDDMSNGTKSYINPEAKFVQGDVADYETVLAASAGCDVIYHLAARRAVQQSLDIPLITNDVNVGGTLNVLESARNNDIERVVFASSSSVYGGSQVLPTPESTPLNPRSPYAVGKMCGEHYARVYAELFGITTVGMRFFNVFGPRQSPTSAYAAVIPLFIEALKSGVPPTVHGDGQQTRDFSFIEDVVEAVIAASVAPAEVVAGKAYNIAPGIPSSLAQMLTTLQELLHTNIEPNFVPTRTGDVRNSHADASAAAADLGWKAQVSFREGLEKTVKWFEA